MVCCIEFIQSLGFQIVLKVSYLFTFRTISQPRGCITQYNIPRKWFIHKICHIQLERQVNVVESVYMVYIPVYSVYAIYRRDKSVWWALRIWCNTCI